MFLRVDGLKLLKVAKIQCKVIIKIIQKIIKYSECKRMRHLY